MTELQKDSVAYNNLSYDLNSKLDSATFALGMIQSQQLKELADTAPIDLKNQIVRWGVYTAVMADNRKHKDYHFGETIGAFMSLNLLPGANAEIYPGDSTLTLSKEKFLQGFLAGALGKKPLIDNCNEFAMELSKKQREKTLLKKYSANKEAGEKFLAENKNKSGIKVLPSGVQYRIIKQGSGVIPNRESVVTVNYEGRLLDGTVFDSSYENGEPIQFKADQVVPGLTEPLTNMPKGSIWEVYIPQNLAYGDRSFEKIKPFSVLIFKLELIDVK